MPDDAFLCEIVTSGCKAPRAVKGIDRNSLSHLLSRRVLVQHGAVKINLVSTQAQSPGFHVIQVLLAIEPTMP